MKQLSDKIETWIINISSEGALPSTIQGLYVGLFEGDSHYQIYMSGSNAYDADDADWACNQDFIPKNKYIDSCVSTNNDWEKFQDDVVESIRQILKHGNTILNSVPHIGVGFDSGDIKLIK